MRNLCALLAILFSFSDAYACERALDGVWQSDYENTMSFNRGNAKLEKRQDDFLSAIMGKMTFTFSGSELHMKMPDTQVRVKGEVRSFAGFEERNPYKVLFCNARMIVIETPEAVTGESSVTTYFFVGPELMWAYTGTNSSKAPDLHLREYFRRVQ